MENENNEQNEQSRIYSQFLSDKFSSFLSLSHEEVWNINNMNSQASVNNPDNLNNFQQSTNNIGDNQDSQNLVQNIEQRNQIQGETIQFSNNNQLNTTSFNTNVMAQSSTFFQNPILSYNSMTQNFQNDTQQEDFIEYNNTVNCPICRDDILDTDIDIAEFTCGHLMHPQCYDRYRVQFQGNGIRCPICNELVSLV